MEKEINDGYVITDRLAVDLTVLAAFEYVLWHKILRALLRHSGNAPAGNRGHGQGHTENRAKAKPHICQKSRRGTQ